MDEEDKKLILECIRKVNDNLGNYYKENIYQNALIIELSKCEYTVMSEVIVPIVYNGHTVGHERADIFIYKNDQLICILELKSQNSKIGNKELHQLIKYLNNVDCHQGYLINFYEKIEIIEVFKDGAHNKISCDTPH